MLMSWKRPESVGGMRLLPRAEVGRQEECRVRLLAVIVSLHLQNWGKCHVAKVILCTTAFYPLVLALIFGLGLISADKLFSNLVIFFVSNDVFNVTHWQKLLKDWRKMKRWLRLGTILSFWQNNQGTLLRYHGCSRRLKIVPSKVTSYDIQ